MKSKDIQYKRKNGVCADRIISVRQINDYIQIQTTRFDGCLQNPERVQIKAVIAAQAVSYREKAASLLDRAYRLEAIADAIDE